MMNILELPYKLDRVSVPDNETGKNMLEEVRVGHSELRQLMASRDWTKEEFQQLTDLSYDFKKLRHEIQRQMTALFMASYRKRSQL